MMENVLSRLTQEPSVNQRWALLYRLGSIATPEDFVRLTSPGPEPWRSIPEWSLWVESVEPYYLMAGKSHPEAFRANALLQWMLHYSDPRFPGSEKTLVVGLTGGADRFMVPLCAILQCFDAASTDVLVARSSILSTRNNITLSFADFIEEIRKQVARLGDYRRIVVLGTSLGGLPALIAGDMLGAESVVAAGAGSPYESWWLDFARFDPHEYLRTSDFRLSATLVVSVDSPADIAHVREIIDLIPCQTCCLFPDKKKIGHISLAAMAYEGDLRPFLEERLLGTRNAAAGPPKLNRKWMPPTLRYRQS